MNFQTLQYASIIALGGTIFTFWTTVRGWLGRASTYVVVQCKWGSDGISSHIMQYYFQNHFRKSPFGIKNYFTGSYFIRPRDRQLWVAFEQAGGTNIYWKGWRPLWFSVATDANNNPTQNFTVSFVRGTFKMEEIYTEAVEYWNKLKVPTPKKDNKPTVKKANRFGINYVFGRRASDSDKGKKEAEANGQVATMGGSTKAQSSEPPDTLNPLCWKRDQLGMPLLPCARPTDMMILSPEVQEAVDEAVFWLESEQWYKERNIPWKRGWLLYGKPGTGKTSLARAIAQELDMPIWVFDLASLTNEELREGWRKMSQEAPCMALLEDIDGTFDGRINIAVEGKYREGLTFDCLLNCIDGVERVNGVLVVVTTNKINKVDPAIGIPQSDGSSSRPGRIDRVIEMREPNRDGLMRVAQRIMDKNPELWDQMVDEAYSKRQTVCQFQEKCAQTALKSRWQTFKLRLKKSDEKAKAEKNGFLKNGHSKNGKKPEVYSGPVLKDAPKDDSQPATMDDIADIQKQLAEVQVQQQSESDLVDAFKVFDPTLRAMRGEKVSHVGRRPQWRHVRHRYGSYGPHYYDF